MDTNDHFRRSKSTKNRWKKNLIKNYVSKRLDNEDVDKSPNHFNSIEPINLNDNFEQNEPVSINNNNLQNSIIPSDEMGFLVDDNYSNQNSEIDIQFINQINDNNSNQISEIDFQLINQMNYNNSKTTCDIILDKIYFLFNKYKLNNVVVDNFLRIIKYVSSHKDENLDNLPSSFYLFKKHYMSNIKVLYGFKSDCCNDNVLMEKDNQNKFHCENCQTIINSNHIFLKKDYYFHFDLRTIIKLLLNAYELIPIKFSDNNLIESYYDSEVYKDLSKQKPDGKLLLLTLYIDGVEITESTSIIKDKSSNNTPKNDVWPIFFKLLNLNCSNENKTFLSSSILCQDPYPNTNIYLKHIVDQLNELFLNGIELNNEIIYPALFNLVCDTPARNLVMNNIAHNGFYGCSFCLVKGKNINHVQVFELVEDMFKKTKEVYNDALIRLNNGYESFLGM